MKKLILSTIILLTFFIATAKADNTKNEIKSVIQGFQNYLLNQSEESLNSVIKYFDTNKNIEWIGAAAIKPNEDEWIFGQKAIKEMLKGDWGWGEQKLDIKQAVINYKGEVAWISIPATLTLILPKDMTYNDINNKIFEDINKIKTSKLSSKKKFYETIKYINGWASEDLNEKSLIWPFVFSAVLIKEKDSWKFVQIQYNFPLDKNLSPPVRL